MKKWARICQAPTRVLAVSIPIPTIFPCGGQVSPNKPWKVGHAYQYLTLWRMPPGLHDNVSLVSRWKILTFSQQY